jgi:hypothetical protein
MTRQKDFKRTVREHAARSGRSYADARRLLLARSQGDAAMQDTATTTDATTAPDPTFKTVSKKEHGFTLAMPEDWAEFPPVLSNSPYEVARFAYRDHTTHLGIVFRMPGSPGLHPRGTAEQARTRQRAQGFDNFVLDDVDVGGRPGVRLTFDKKTLQGAWAAREYFVSAGSLVYCLALASGDPQGDAALFDAMAARFDVGRD